MLKVYLDNDVASAISQHDCDRAQRDAIDLLLEANRSGNLAVGTSRQSPREMERAPPQHQAKLKTGLSELDLAKDDHKVLGFHTQTDQHGGCISNPLVTDIVDGQMYEDLLAAGLKTDDAKHLMYAVHNGYQRFLTCDNGILSRRADFEKRCCPSMRIQRPSELAAELSDATGCPAGPTKSQSGAEPGAAPDRGGN
ncbi:MAG: hypothetical protein KJ749_14715 [Planctomycetes bacterium]|nr:hypothetical protein [Planctomycetota bacterium]